MNHRRRSLLALVVVLVLMVVVSVASGCTKAPSTSGGTGGPQKGGTFTFYLGDTGYIDPYNAQTTEDAQVVHTLFTPLVTLDPKDPSKLLPGAAEKWSANASATVWTFNLDKNDKFSDGTPVKAQDFIYGWNRIADPKGVNTTTKKADPSVLSYHLSAIQGTDDNGQAPLPGGISGLKAIDDYTLEVTLKQPFGDFEFVAAHPSLVPVPKALVEGGVDFNGTKVAYGDMPVGNGPFKMAEPWKPGQLVKVVRNDDYFGAKPFVDGIEFRIFKDPDTAYLEFQAGNLDFAQISLGKIKDAQTKYGTSDDGYTGNPGKQVLLGAENSTYYLVVKNEDPALSKLEFRKAISYGINRKVIADTLFEGTREPADNIVPPGIAGYQPGVWAFSKFDEAAAKQALAAAGYPDGKGAPEVTLAYNADGGHQKIMELVQADLTKLGLKVKLAPTADFPTYLKTLEARKFMIGRLGWNADYPIFDNFMNPLFNSKSADNYSRFSDPKVDEAIKAAREITDTAERIKAYQEVDKTIGEQLPVIPLMFYKHHHVTSSRVNDFTFSPMYLGDFTKVWLTGGGKASSETTSK